MRQTVRALIFATAGLLAASSASAASFSYGNYAGVTVDFLNVAEDTGVLASSLFDAPTPAGDQLFFFPSDFSSYSQNGSSNGTTGVLTMSIRAHAGLQLQSITLAELGDYALAGIGTSATWASIDADLKLVDVTPGTNGAFFSAAVISPASPYTLSSPGTSGQFDGSVTIDLTGLGISEVSLQFTNTLATASELGTTAFIQKKVVNGPQISASAAPAVPEPAAALVFGAGALVIARGMRRRG